MRKILDNKLKLLIVPYSNIISWCNKRVPRNVEPAIAGQELIGIVTGLQELHQSLELPRLFGSDVGSLTQ